MAIESSGQMYLRKASDIQWPISLIFMVQCRGSCANLFVCVSKGTWECPTDSHRSLVASLEVMWYGFGFMDGSAGSCTKLMVSIWPSGE
jgi:hypothetical protein